LQTAARLLRQDQLSELAVPEKRLGPVFVETNGGGAMSIDQDHLMRTQEQILIDYDRLRQEGKKHAEASQTVIDRWRNTEGWNGGKIYTLIQNTHRLRAQAAKVKTEPTETTEVAEMAATTG
jgi:hypothetical protein